MPSLLSNSNRFFGYNSSVAIVSLWTPVEMVAKRLDKKNYGIIGNLYSSERGLDALIRNLLAHPKIKHLIITGTDIANSGQVLRDFFEKGFFKGKTKETKRDCWRVNSKFDGYIELDISKEALEELRLGIRIYNWDLISPFNNIKLESMEYERPKRVFEKRLSFVKKYFGEPTTFVFRSKNFLEAWFLSLDSIVKFGTKIFSQKKLFNSVFELSLEKKNSLTVPDFLSFNTLDCHDHFQQWASELAFSSLGVRLKKLKSIRQTFSLSPHAKACMTIEKINNSLYGIVTIQKIGAWEFGIVLASLQALFESAFSQDFGVFLSNIVITVVVLDYTILEEDTQRVQELLARHYDKVVTPIRLLRDWRGNFVIYLSQGEIVIEHLSPSNELLYMYTGKTALELRNKLLREGIVGSVPHAFYLGTELQKAEIALRKGLYYVQEKPLNFLQKPKKSKKKL